MKTYSIRKVKGKDKYNVLINGSVDSFFSDPLSAQRYVRLQKYIELSEKKLKIDPININSEEPKAKELKPFEKSKLKEEEPKEFETNEREEPKPTDLKKEEPKTVVTNPYNPFNPNNPSNFSPFVMPVPIQPYIPVNMQNNFCNHGKECVSNNHQYQNIHNHHNYTNQYSHCNHFQENRCKQCMENNEKNKNTFEEENLKENTFEDKTYTHKYDEAFPFLKNESEFQKQTEENGNKIKIDLDDKEENTKDYTSEFEKLFETKKVKKVLATIEEQNPEEPKALEKEEKVTETKESETASILIPVIESKSEKSEEDNIIIPLGAPEPEMTEDNIVVESNINSKYKSNIKKELANSSEIMKQIVEDSSTSEVKPEEVDKIINSKSKEVLVGNVLVPPRKITPKLLKEFKEAIDDKKEEPNNRNIDRKTENENTFLKKPPTLDNETIIPKSNGIEDYVQTLQNPTMNHSDETTIIGIEPATNVVEDTIMDDIKDADTELTGTELKRFKKNQMKLRKKENRKMKKYSQNSGRTKISLATPLEDLPSING